MNYNITIYQQFIEIYLQKHYHKIVFEDRVDTKRLEEDGDLFYTRKIIYQEVNEIEELVLPSFQNIEKINPYYLLPILENEYIKLRMRGIERAN